MKRFLKLLPIYLLILTICGYGIWQFVKEHRINTSNPQSQPIQTDSDIVPATEISFGDTFEYCPSRATGYMECRILGTTVIKNVSDCPPLEGFSEKSFCFPEGYNQAEPYEQGCRLVLVELEVTNVNAEGYTYDGTVSMSCGWFKDPYVFHPHDIMDLANLDILHGDEEEPESWYFEKYSDFYFDLRCDYMEQDDRDTMGVETEAIRIAPGESRSFTVGFAIPGQNGKETDLTMLRGILRADSNPETGIFLNLGLGGS